MNLLQPEYIILIGRGTNVAAFKIQVQLLFTALGPSTTTWLDDSYKYPKFSK